MGFRVSDVSGLGMKGLGCYMALYRDNGKENGMGLCRVLWVGKMEKKMETTQGFRVQGSG